MNHREIPHWESSIFEHQIRMARALLKFESILQGSTGGVREAQHHFNFALEDRKGRYGFQYFSPNPQRGFPVFAVSSMLDIQERDIMRYRTLEAWFDMGRTITPRFVWRQGCNNIVTGTIELSVLPNQPPESWEEMLSIVNHIRQTRLS